jgi:hypothetical protein
MRPRKRDPESFPCPLVQAPFQIHIRVQDDPGSNNAVSASRKKPLSVVLTLFIPTNRAAVI